MSSSRLRRPRPLLRIALLVIVTYLALCAIGGAWLGGAALHTPRRTIDATAARAARAVADRQAADLEAVAATAADGAALRGWLFRPRGEYANGDAVLLIHGVGDTRVGMLGIAEMLLSAGYVVLAADARAHGESGGALTTYGVLERQDVQQWVHWLRAAAPADGGSANSADHAARIAAQAATPRVPREGVRGCIHGLGVSMGAAHVLQALETDAGLCSAVVESPFASFREIAFDRVASHAGVPPWAARTLPRPLVESGLFYVRLRYGIDLERASPLHAVERTQTPILLIQGDRDRHVPPRHARLLQAANPDLVTLWMIGSDAHASLASVDADAWRERVLLFLAANDGRRATGLSHSPHAPRPVYASPLDASFVARGRDEARRFVA